jgi:hypothetical protein
MEMLESQKAILIIATVLSIIAILIVMHEATHNPDYIRLCANATWHNTCMGTNPFYGR